MAALNTLMASLEAAMDTNIATVGDDAAAERDRDVAARKSGRVEVASDEPDIVAEDRDKPRTLYCIVLRAIPAVGTFAVLNTQEKVDKHREWLLASLRKAGLGYQMFYSTQMDEIYVKVLATDRRLLVEADGDEPFYLELDPDAMETVALSDKDADRAPIKLKPPFDHAAHRFERKAGIRDEVLALPGALKHKSAHDSTNHVAAERMNPGWVPVTDDELMSVMHRSTKLDPFVHLYAPYCEAWETHHLKVNGVEVYRRRRDGTLLYTFERLRALHQIMERTDVPNPGSGARGCALNLDKEVIEKRVLAAFPYAPFHEERLTMESNLDQLFTRWVGVFKLPWKQPLDDIRVYFGEKVALYYAFVGHYALWVSGAAVIGLAMFVHQLINVQEGTGSANLLAPSKLVINVTGSVAEAHLIVYTEVPELPFYSLFVMIWGTVMFEFWKRKQIRLAMRWGQTKFANAETTRPEFQPSHYVVHPVTGEGVPYYNSVTFLTRLIFAGLFVATAIIIVVSTVASIMVLKVFLSLDPEATGLDQENATLLGLVFNAIAIQVLAIVYRDIAVLLTEWENHSTDSKFEKSLIVKSFVFSFCNCYATLFYIAFLKRGEVILGQEQLCDHNAKANVTGIGIVYAQDQCFGNLGYSLLIIQIVQIVKNNIVEVLIPTLTAASTRRANLKETDLLAEKRTFRQKLKHFLFTWGVIKEFNDDTVLTDEEKAEKERLRLLSQPEEQFFVPHYAGTFSDYLELMLQFGYATLFVAAFPLAPVLAAAAIQVAMRTKAYKLCKLMRRPSPFGSGDIGMWENVFYFMSYMSVFTNAGVIFFTADIVAVPNDINISPDAFRVWMWAVSCVAVLSVKLLLNAVIASTPEDVRIQLQRQDFFIQKCFVVPVPAAGNTLKPGKPAPYSDEIEEVDPDQRKNVIKVLTAVANEMGKDTLFAKLHVLKSEDREEVTLKQLSEILLSAKTLNDLFLPSEWSGVPRACDWNGNGHIYVRDLFALIEEGLAAEAKKKKKKIGV